MGQATKKYGEAPREREQNGRKLKEIRLKLGLTARQAAELLELNNTSAIVNCETACSSEMFSTRMKQYANLKDHLATDTKRAADSRKNRADGSVVNGADLTDTHDHYQMPEREQMGSARQNMRTKNMLEIAVRRLAKVEKTSEVDIWLNLIDLCAQQDSR